MINSIVITGSIGTGKSTVCEMLRQRNYSVIDADEIAHCVLDQNYLEIGGLFGNEYIVNGRIDRKRLGELVFGDAKERLKLENLLHPKIREIILQKCNELMAKNKLFFVDIPLFFETKAYEFEHIAVVYAPKNIQVERLMHRNNMTANDVLKRIDAQIDIEIKKQKTNFVIDNSGDKAKLKESLEIFLQRIKG